MMNMKYVGREVTKMFSSFAIPDLNRLWIMEKLKSASDDTNKELYQALLIGYDSGELVLQFDSWTGEMKYKLSMVN